MPSSKNETLERFAVGCLAAWGLLIAMTLVSMIVHSVSPQFDLIVHPGLHAPILGVSVFIAGGGAIAAILRDEWRQDAPTRQ